MAQIPSILGQNKPDAGVHTNLFTVALNTQAQFSIFVANQGDSMDKVTISLIPDGGSETDATYIAYETPILAHAVMAFAGLFMKANDQVIIYTQNGTTSFTATGMLYA